MLNVSRGNGGFLMSHIGGQGLGLPSLPPTQGKEASARVLGNVTTKGVESEKERDWLLNRSEKKKKTANINLKLSQNQTTQTLALLI